MTHLLQIMSHMMIRLEYDANEVEASFEFLMDMLEASLPKWRSALKVTEMRMESGE